MTQIANDYPDVVTIMDYGQTYEKRKISLLKVIFIYLSIYFINYWHTPEDHWYLSVFVSIFFSRLD